MFQYETTRGHGPVHSRVTWAGDVGSMRTAALLFAFLIPTPLHAQGPRHSISPPAPATSAFAQAIDSMPARDDLTLAFGGALAGISGLVAGAFIGAHLERAGGCSGDWCGLGGGLVGAAIGTTMMIPVGVHLSNDERGNLSQGLSASALALAGGMAMTLIIQDGTPMLFVPIAQIMVAVAAERRTER